MGFSISFSGITSALKDGLEDIANALGIEDEYITHAFRTSFKVFDDGTDSYEKCLTRAILANPRNGSGFFRNYWKEVNRSGTLMRVASLEGVNTPNPFSYPAMEFLAGKSDEVANLAALESHRGPVAEITSTRSTTPSIFTMASTLLEQTHDLNRDGNTLTYTNPDTGLTASDWRLFSSELDEETDEWVCYISQTVDETIFRLDGMHSRVVSTGAAPPIQIRTNQPLQDGVSAEVEIIYGGTALRSGHFTGPSTVTIPDGGTFGDLNLVIDSACPPGRTLTITIGTITPVLGFGAETRDLRASRYAPTRELIVVDGYTPVLIAGDAEASDEDLSIQIPVTLSGTTAAPFTVDYALTPDTAVAGRDYIDSTGTLTFSGAEETQWVTVTYETPVQRPDYKKFQVALSNPSDTLVDIKTPATVTLVRALTLDDSPEDTNGVKFITIPTVPLETSLILEYTEIGGRLRTWIYPYSDGTYPDMPPTINALVGGGTLPVNPLLIDKFEVNSNSPPAEYSELKEQVEDNLTLLGLDLTQLVDLLKENESYSSIDDASVIFAVSPAEDDAQSVAQVFWIYWNWLREQESMSSNYNSYSITVNAGGIFKTAYRWTDQEWSEDLPLDLANDRLVALSVGDCYHTLETRPKVISFTPTGLPGEEPDGFGFYSHYITPEQPTITVYYRLSETEYQTLSIVGLKSDNFVAFNFEGQEKFKTMTVPCTDPDFVFPITDGILDNMSARDLTELFPLSLRVDVWGGTIQTVRYYQTSEFALLLDIVKVVVTVYFWYAGGGAWIDLLIDAAYNYVIAELSMFALEEIAKETGNKDLLIFVALVIAFATSDAGFSMDSLTDPMALVDLVTNFSNNASIAFSQITEDLKKEEEEKEAAHEEKMEEMDAMLEVLLPDVGDYIVTLNSLDSIATMAGEAQYDYDLIFGYDSLIADFTANKLTLGVV